MCAGLWCLVEGDTSCKTKLDPPLDGTECGADKVIKMLSSSHFVFSSIVCGIMLSRCSVFAINPHFILILLQKLLN